jgi:RNA polymerase sigma-70 factor (ECF subfamily)
MNEQERKSLFADLVIRYQSELYAYIFALVRNREDAGDLLQSVCLVLWRKFDSFQPQSSFFSWARQVAVFEVRNALKRKKLTTYVSDELLDVLIDSPDKTSHDSSESYVDALRQCRSRLTAIDDDMLKLRYIEDLGTRQIADQLGRSQPSVCNSLMRIRRLLFECIRSELARQQRSKGEPS